MLNKIAPLILVTVITACSSPLERRQVNGDIAYIEAKPAPMLVIPAALQTPPYRAEYQLAPLGPDADLTLIGKKLDIRPPVQVLPVADGTYVDDAQHDIAIIVESIDNQLDLQQEIMTNLTDFLAAKNIAIRHQDAASVSIETDWVEHQQLLQSAMLEADKGYLLRQRYRFDIDMRSHRRSATVTVQAIEQQIFFDDNTQAISVTGEDKQRVTTEILNEAIAHMRTAREQWLQAHRLKQTLGIDVVLANTQEGSPIYGAAQAPYQQVWDRLRLVLPEMGFEIADMDSSKGLYFIKYEDNSHFWNRLWGKQPVLKSGNYRIQLETGNSGQETYIFLRDDVDQPLPDATNIYQSLASLMQAKRS